MVTLFVCCILFQSCYSYKAFKKTSKDLSVGKLYKFDLTNGKEFNIIVDSLDQNSIYGKVNKVSVKIPHSEIKIIESGEKSKGKTVSAIVAIVVGTAVLIAALLTNNWI